MIHLTQAAVDKLHDLILDHPEDPIVRVMVRDEDETTLTFTITLEPKTQPEDEIQEYDGLTVAVERKSRSRLDGMTIDYHQPGGFQFLHPDHRSGGEFNLIQLN